MTVPRSTSTPQPPDIGAKEASGPVGIILIDKPAKRAVSSVTACRRVKRALSAGGANHAKLKVGHAGTLDPLASGLLIILVGRAATKMCSQLMDGPKVYVAQLDLLKSTVSDDLETETTINDVRKRPSLADVEGALAAFRGVIMQRPPAFSAIWIDGVRAFKLARKAVRKDMESQSEDSRSSLDDQLDDPEGSLPTDGRRGLEGVVSLPPKDLPILPERPITIHALDLVEYDWPFVTVRVHCSKGTYIRSLVRDIGIAITGFPAVLTALRRTAVGPFDVSNAIELEQLPAAITQADLLPVPDKADNPGKP